MQNNDNGIGANGIFMTAREQIRQGRPITIDSFGNVIELRNENTPEAEPPEEDTINPYRFTGTDITYNIRDFNFSINIDNSSKLPKHDKVVMSAKKEVVIPEIERL